MPARLGLVAVLAASLLSAAPAAAADRPSRRDQLAVELSRLALPEAAHEQIRQASIDQVRAGVEQMMLGSDREVPARIREVVYDEMRGIVAAMSFGYQETIDLQAGLLAKHYTEAELEQLVAFYRSPVGQKAIRVMPAVMQDAMAAGTARMQQQLPGLLEAMARRIEAERAAMAAEGGGGSR